MLVDCVVHLEDPRIEDPAALLERARAAGTTEVVAAATCPTRPPPVMEHPGVRIHRCVGLHPSFVDEGWPARVAQVEANCAEGVVAVGEIGLDRRPGQPPIRLQLGALRAQLDVARKHDRPVLIHAVRAWQRMLAELDERPVPGGVVHGFAGAPEIAAELHRRGLAISFGSAALNHRSTKVQRTLRELPALDRVCLESDAPDHDVETPHQVLRALAELRGLPEAELRAASVAAARQALRLPAR